MISTTQPIQLAFALDGTVDEGHERCLDCHRLLKDAVSRQEGRGPTCRRRHLAQQAFIKRAAAGREGFLE